MKSGQRPEAIDVRREAMPHAILLDWNMPVMSGIEFLWGRRGLSGGAGSPMVFCIMQTDLDRIREALEAGADEYIMTPFDAEIPCTRLGQLGLLDG